jgi:hypothetical protein
MASSRPDPRGYLTEGPDEHGRRSWAMYEADDGTVYYGQEAIEASNRHWEAGGFRGLQRDVGRGFETRAGWLTRRRPVGRAPRRATNGRTRGSRRSGSSSRTSSTDPGDGDPEPPGVGRPQTWRRTAGVAR